MLFRSFASTFIHALQVQENIVINEKLSKYMMYTMTNIRTTSIIAKLYFCLKELLKQIVYALHVTTSSCNSIGSSGNTRPYSLLQESLVLC